MYRKSLWLSAALLALSLSGPAKADSVDTFTYVSNGNTFVWQFPASPVPDSGNVSPFGFILETSFTENGVPSTDGDIAFFTDATGGGLNLDTTELNLIEALGPQLFSGANGSPTFLTGTFNLMDSPNGTEDVFPGTLVISTPEPTSVLLLLIGLLALLATFRSKRVSVPSE